MDAADSLLHEKTAVLRDTQRTLDAMKKDRHQCVQIELSKLGKLKNMSEDMEMLMEEESCSSHHFPLKLLERQKQVSHT